MKLFGKEEINTSRQIEFDLAKAVCILGMVFVHCFEELAQVSDTGDSTAYYIMVTVLDSIFGAGTFMICMGLGIAYSWKENADKLIKRGMMIFLFSYLLNIARDGIPSFILALMGKSTFGEAILWIISTDIMPFAGLALMLFGILKKLKLSDAALFAVALAMSVVGSFVRFIDTGNLFLNELIALIIGTVSLDMPELMAYFPLLNWFIVVVIGYLYAKVLRRCCDLKRYYAITFPLSGAILAVYMLIAIPNRLGMMSEQIEYYYQFTTPNVLILLLGTIFATGLYHYISLLFSDRARKIVTRLSSNINRIYCIHWVIIGWMSFALTAVDSDGFSDAATFIVGVAIYIAANILAELYTRSLEKRSRKIRA